MALLNLLLNQLLIFLPFGVLLRFQVSSGVYVYPHDVVLFLVFLYISVYHLKKKIFPAPRNIFLSVTFFVSICFVSLLWNIYNLSLYQFFVSFLYLFRFMLYSSLIFTFALLKKDFINSYIKKAVLSGFVFVLFGVLQYIFYPSLKELFYFGWDEHLYRLTSTLFDPNFAGPLVTFEVLFLMSILFVKKNKIKKGYKLSLFVGLFISCVALILTYSRSSILMFLTSCGMFFILLREKKWLFSFVLMLFVAILLVPKDFKIEGMNLFRTVSTNDRIESIKRSVTIFQKSPVLGVGFNAYRYTQKKFGFLDTQWDITHSGAGVSNSYFFVLATTGILGFAFFIDFIFVLFQELKKSSNLRMRIVSIAALSGVLVHSLFENTFFYPFIMIWLFLIIGVTVCRKQ